MAANEHTQPLAHADEVADVRLPYSSRLSKLYIIYIMIPLDTLDFKF